MMAKAISLKSKMLLKDRWIASSSGHRNCLIQELQNLCHISIMQLWQRQMNLFSSVEAVSGA